MRRNFYCLVLIFLSVLTPTAIAAEEKLNFTPLFNGEDFAGWCRVNLAPDTFTINDGVIHSTGVPTGFMRTEKQYENFVVELDWLHEKPAGNAGLFVFGFPLPAVGTPFARGIEIQILDDAYVVERYRGLYTGHGDVFSIQGASMKPDRPHPSGWQRCLPSENRCKPAGQWNHYRVEARDGRVTLAVNGKIVSGGGECVPRKGYICLESEGAPAQFKNIRIAELPSGNPKPEQCAPLAEDFTSLYTGVDLAGWVVDAGHKEHWAARDWRLNYDGKSKATDKTLWTDKEFGDFVLSIDYRFPIDLKEDPNANNQRGGILLRGDPKALIKLEANPLAKPPGQWNRIVITARGSSAKVELNGETLYDAAPISHLPPRGRIGLAGDAGYAIEFANLFIREIK